MTKDPLEQRLRGSDFSQIPDIAREVRTAARRDTRDVVRLWAEEDLNQAAYLLSNLGEISLGVLAELRRPLSVTDAAWLVTTLPALFDGVRQRVLERYRESSTDKRVVPIAANEDGEPVPTPRVCDLAYLASFDMLDSERTPLRAASRKDAFLELEDDERDQVIAAYFSSPWFLRALGEGEDS